MAPLKGKPRAAIVAALIVIVAAVAVMAWSGQRLAHVGGALQLAAGPQQRIWLAFDAAALRLDADGRVEAAIPLAPLGIDTAAAIVPMPDGSAWIGDLEHHRLVLVSAEGRALGQAAPPPAAGALFGTFHAAYQPAADRLVVADTQNHRLLAFTGAGQYLGANGPALALRFPNGLAADARGRLLLANTNEQALQWLNPDLSPAPGAFARPAPGAPQGFPGGYTWPVFTAVAPDGAIYASWHDNTLGPGAIVAYDGQGHCSGVLSFGADGEPQSFLARADDLLVALKSGNRYSLERFGRDGRALGAFGDAAVRARLDGASARTSALRSAQAISRALVLVGAVVMLGVALRLRRRAELAAADAIIKPRREVPRGNGAFLLFAVCLMFAALLLVQWRLFRWSASAGRIAYLQGGHTEAFLTVLGISSLTGVLMFALILGWRATPWFVQLQNRAAARLLQAWAPHLPPLLSPGEEVEDHAVAPGLWTGRLLLATNRRLLFVPAVPGYSRKPLWQCAWSELRPLAAAPRPWWLRLLNPSGVPIEFSAAGRPPLRVHALNREHAANLHALIDAARERDFARTQPLQPPAQSAAAAKPPPALRAALLSLLLPGLGQLDQGRTRHGTGLLLISLALLGGSLLSWLVALGRFADQPHHTPIRLAAMYLPVLVYAVWDTLRYAREGKGFA